MVELVLVPSLALSLSVTSVCLGTALQCAPSFLKGGGRVGRGGAGVCLLDEREVTSEQAVTTWGILSLWYFMECVSVCVGRCIYVV